jgi:hypothetical protein
MNGILGNPHGMGTLSGKLRVERRGGVHPRRALGASDPDVARLQTNVNHWLATHGFAALTVDGVIGPRTCGATRKSGTPPPAACTSFTEPTPGKYPWNVPSADTRAMQVELVENYPSLKVDSILGPLTCGAARTMSQYGIFVPSTCQSFTDPAPAPSAPPPVATAPAPAPAAPGAPAAAPIDWVALAQYAAAVKAANDKRAADLVAYAQYLKNEKDKADMIAYAQAVQAANDKRAADLVAYAQYLKDHAAQPAGTPPPDPPPPPPPPVPRPPVVMRYVPPPPPMPRPPARTLSPAHASAEVQAGMGAAMKVGIGLGVSALALVGYMVFFKAKKARAA